MKMLKGGVHRPLPQAPLAGSPGLQAMTDNVNGYVDETVRQLCEAAQEAGMPSDLVNELIARIKMIPAMAHMVTGYGAALASEGRLVA